MTPLRRRLLAISIGLLLLIVAVFFGYCIPNYSVSSETISSTLQALITAQASVLAIVFSVAFVTTQIVSSRYSPAFIKLFVKSPLLREALYLSVGSIFIPLSVLTLSPLIGLNAQQSLYIWSIEITGAVLLVVLIYAGILFEQTTPTNLLRQYKNQLSSTDYRNQSIDAGENNSLADHPLQPIYDLTRSSIQRDEIAVASEGEETLYEIVDKTVEDQIKTDKISSIELPEDYDDEYATTDESAKVGILFTPVLSKYLPRIALSTIDKNYIEISEASINHLGRIGEKGANYGCYTLSDLALMTIYSDIMLALSDPIEEDSGHSRALHFTVENSLDIVGQHIENNDLEHFHEVSPHVYEIMRWVDGVTPKQDLVHNPTIKELIDRQVDWYKAITEKFKTEISEENPTLSEMLGNKNKDDLKIGQSFDSKQHNNLKISALINIRLHMMTITAKNYKSRDWPDENGTVPMFINGAWRDLLKYAVTNPPAASAVLLLQRYIEVVGHETVERDDTSYTEGPANLFFILDTGGILPFEVAFNRIMENPEHEDYFGYSTFRGLGRGSLWFPFRMYDYSEEFIDAIKGLRADLRKKYWGDKFEKGASTGEELNQYLELRTDEW